MTKLFFKFFLFALALGALQYCDKNNDKPAPPVVGMNQSFTQGFESIADAKSQGWIFRYQSNDPDYTYGWDVKVGGAFEGASSLYSYNDYLSNSNSDDADSSISNWAISPAVWVQNGDSISFYTYSDGQTKPVPIAGGRVADRLQLRMTRLDSSANTGTTSSDIGNFTVPLLDINPTLSTASGAYPATWKRYVALISGLNEPIQARFAIRYYVPDFYNNGWGVYVDKVTFTSSIAK